MKKRNRIGIFDSGLGGLTVMKALKQACPNENLVYFGDTARVPYGGKSPETIIRYSVENGIFLMEQDIKMLVIACNTASAFAIDKLKGIFNIPIVDVIEPGAEKAVRSTKNKKIAVLGTKATILSGSYQKKIQSLTSGAQVFAIPCPLFVPMVEERFLNHEAMELIVKEYLKPLQGTSIDTMLLGCTHYPVLKPLIQKVMGPDVQIVDSATTCAEHVNHKLQALGIASDEKNQEIRFFVSDDPGKFKDLGPFFYGEPIETVESVMEPAWR